MTKGKQKSPEHQQTRDLQVIETNTKIYKNFFTRASKARIMSLICSHQQQQIPTQQLKIKRQWPSPRASSHPEATIVTQGRFKVRARAALSPERGQHLLHGILALHGRQASLLEAVRFQAQAECVHDSYLERRKNEKPLSMQHRKQTEG